MNPYKKIIAELLIYVIIIFLCINLYANMEKENTTAIFSLALDGNNEIKFNNPLNSILANELNQKGYKVYNSFNTPLISKEILEYTIIKGKENKQFAKTSGRIYLELGSDGSAKIESENGFSPYSKIEINSIAWELDKQDAIRMLNEEQNIKYAIFLTAKWENITQEISNSYNLSGQKSIRTSIEMSLFDLSQNVTTKSFYNEIPVMDASSSSAAIKGWKILIKKGITQFFE